MKSKKDILSCMINYAFVFPTVVMSEIVSVTYGVILSTLLA